jgi:hypothetical protein
MIQYTALADPLLAYIDSLQAQSTSNSDSLNVNATLGADYYLSQPGIMTANFGFDGYMGVPGLVGTGTQAQQVAFDNNVSWNPIDPTLNAAARAYYSAVGSGAFASIYGVPANLLDTIPVVFTHPVLGSSVDPTDFAVSVNTGEIVTPVAASFLPNLEFNERQTVVITGDWGNRENPDSPDARYPVSVSIVNDDSPLQFITSTGLVSAVGMRIDSANPYVQGNGPRLLAAKLDAYSDLGEGSPSWQTASTANSGSDLYGSQAAYRLRLYTSAGFSPDGIASITPDDFATFFQVIALDDQGQEVLLTQANVAYTIAGFGEVTILGIADTGLQQSSYNAAYVEDHDNQYDIILAGDAAAIAQLQSVRMPSSGDYSPVYNPGGPGSDPENNPPGPFTVPSSDQTIAISRVDEASDSQVGLVTYVEVDGAVTRDADSGQPIGADWGLAVFDSATGHTVNQYVDPTGKLFYSSFAVSPDFSIVLTEAQPSDYSRATNDQITGTGGIDSVAFSGDMDQYVRTGSLPSLVSQDLVVRRDALDQLTDVERLLYADVALALDIDGNAGSAYSLYGAFDRAPDLQGIGFWIDTLDSGASLDQVAQGFVGSAEFVSDYGQAPTNESYVRDLYQNFLERAPDDVGFTYWVDNLQSGSMDFADVMVGFAGSVEYQGMIASEISQGIQYDLWLD